MMLQLEALPLRSGIRQEYTLMICKLAPLHGRQGETKEKGRSLQIGRWQDGILKKQGDLQGLSWAATRQVDL